MKRWIIPLLLLATCQTPPSDRYATVAGRGVSGECWKFALAFAQTLHREQAAGWIVVYDWKNGPDTQGRHAFVVYQEKKQFWGIDNLAPQPRPLPPTPDQWAPTYSQSTNIKIIDIFSAQEADWFLAR